MDPLEKESLLENVIRFKTEDMVSTNFREIIICFTLSVIIGIAIGLLINYL